jgi:stress-induced morphogen
MHTSVGRVATTHPVGSGCVLMNNKKHLVRFCYLTRVELFHGRSNSVEVISEQFAGKSMVARHRLVYATLDGEMVEGGIHALALKTKTPAEMAKTSPANP